MTAAVPRMPGVALLLALLLLTLAGVVCLSASVWRIEEDLPLAALHDASELDVLARDVWRFRLAAHGAIAEPEERERLAELALARNALRSSIGHVHQHVDLEPEERQHVDRLILGALAAADHLLAASDARPTGGAEQLRFQAQALADFVPRLLWAKSQLSLGMLRQHQAQLSHIKINLVLLWSLGIVAGLGCGLLARRQRGAERAAEWARQQLRNAIESIDEGFALFDADDRLVMHNRRYTELYSSLGTTIPPGTPFAQLQATFLSKSTDPEDRARRADWNRLRAAWRKDHPGEAADFQTPDGRWLRLTDSRTPDGGTVSVQSEVTEARQREQALRASEARFRSLSDSSPIGIYQIDAANRAVYANPAFCRMLGIASVEELRDRSWLEIVTPEYRERLRHHRAQRDAGITSSFEADLAHAQGRRVHALITGTPLSDGAGRLTGVLVTFLDITPRKEAESRLRHLAEHDVLCGLPNRALFSTLVQQAVDDSRNHGAPFALLALDIDHFKEVNDSLGHAAGDALLRHVADRLRSTVRSSDVVARLSGDEFAVLLRDVADHERAQTIAWKVVRRLREPFLIEGQVLHSSGSVGLALFPEDGETSDQLLRHADLALYASKAAGRNACTRFELVMSERMSQRKQLERRLWHALEGDALSVLYQPQVDLASGHIVGAEALLRWTDPELGPVPPGEFIPVAEASGLIAPLGEWVLKNACLQIIAWGAEATNVRMSVNLSSVQVKRPDLGLRVKEILAEAGLRPERLELEITEGVLLDDTARVRDSLQELRQTGIGLALDDFGTGYSSLGYLKRFPIDRIKIDRSFVADLGRSAQDDALVRAVIGLGHSLGVRVIAEGVEEAAQLELLRTYGCDQAQGFHVGRPVPAEAFLARLRAQNRVLLAS